MTMQKFTDIQKERIISIIESKATNKGICNCDNPNMRVLDGQYYLPLLSATYGNEPITLINVLCENCGRLRTYSKDFFENNWLFYSI